MGRMLFTADPHFGHWTAPGRGVIQYCGRPWKAEQGTPEMNEALISNIVSAVQPDDKLFVLGDVSFWIRSWEVAALIKRIPCEKILIRGNHDDRRSNAKWKEIGFDSVWRHMSWFDDRVGCNVVLNHDPVATIVCPDDIVLCGHVHQIWKTLGRCINVGVDVWDYKPCEYETDLLPLMLALKDVPYSEFTDNKYDAKNAYERIRAVESALVSAPHLGTITAE